MTSDPSCLEGGGVGGTGGRGVGSGVGGGEGNGAGSGVGGDGRACGATLQAGNNSLTIWKHYHRQQEEKTTIEWPFWRAWGLQTQYRGRCTHRPVDTIALYKAETTAPTRPCAEGTGTG